MSEVFILRHSKRDADGNLTEEGEVLARRIAAQLSHVSLAASSSAPRAKQTAAILFGNEPSVDTRAGFYASIEDRAKEISDYAEANGMSFIEAAYKLNDGELAAGISEQATALDSLINEMLRQLPDDGSGLIISHGMTIAPAMALRGLEARLPDYVAGYRVQADGTTSLYPIELTLWHNGG